jgi:spore coat polysaccharide biosynthesis predicted glycosyltransferase SpsG
MLPRRVVFAANATTSTGAGHVMRLVEISKALPSSIEKCFIGSVELPWVKELLDKSFPFQSSEVRDIFGKHDLVVLDSYDDSFCRLVANSSRESTVVQVADRYTPLLPKSLIIYMDLPFDHENKDVSRRIVAHGISFVPARKLHPVETKFQPIAKKVLVTTGGSVDKRVFSQLVSEVVKDEYRAIDFHFIGTLDNSVQKNLNVHFHEMGSGIDSIAQDCDTAISAAGTSMWGLLSNNRLLGLAAIVENQKANYSYVISSKHALPVFDLDNIELDVGVLRTLLFDETSRRNIYRAISGQYDTLGASRVCELLLKVHNDNFHRNEL